MLEFKYFTELEPDKSIKVGISALVGKLSDKLSSHKSGWAFMLMNQLKHAGYQDAQVITSDKTNWQDFDVILIDHGMEFKGTFNIFGGANDELYHQISRLFLDDVRMYSLHHEMPCVGELIEKRLKTGTELFKTLGDRIELAKELCSNIQRVDHIQKTEKLCFGDSHSFSQYTPGFMCDRNDGLTLFGALKRGFEEYIYPWTEELRIYLGNIDIRHHLMRQSNPQTALDGLLNNYEAELLRMQERGVKKIEVISVLPIEHESRKLPKTGYYKGTPFAGTWSERAELVHLMNQGIEEMCSRNDWQVWKHPEVFVNVEGELRFDVMEKPRSVHIAREFYRWDLEADEPNRRLHPEIDTKALF